MVGFKGDGADLEVGVVGFEGADERHEVDLHEQRDHVHVPLVFVQDVRRHLLALPPETEGRFSLWVWGTSTAVN